MELLKYTWKNYGMIRRGYDIAQLKVILKNSHWDNMTLIIDASEIIIEDKMFNYINKQNALDVKSAFEKLEKIVLPQQTDYNQRGCDGSAWELEIDGTKYVGYLSKPKFLNEILEIIHFNEIFEYAKNKLQTYVNN